MRAAVINNVDTPVAKAKHVYVEAIMFPACECGESWPSHGSCGGYKPGKPIRFVSNDWIANWLFAAESFFRRLREARARSK